MLKYLIPVVLLSAVLPAAAPAQEAHADVHVAYRDLNLQSPAGVHTLDRRIERAIAMVCPDSGTLDMARKQAIEHCRTAKRAEVADRRAAVLGNAARGTVEVAAARVARQ